MKTIRKLGLGIMLLASSQMAMAVSVPNIDFESGLTGWTVAPLATPNITTGTVLGANQGTSYGQISGSGVLSQLISVAAGQTYDFMWRFITSDYLPFNDQSVVFHVNNSDVLASVASVGNTIGNTFDTGWQYFSWVSDVTTISGSLSFSLFNAGDNNVDSKLLLDAVPLPVAPLLFGSALLGFAALRKKLTGKPVGLATA